MHAFVDLASLRSGAAHEGLEGNVGKVGKVGEAQEMMSSVWAETEP